jgi:translocation and assembly module TamB
VGAVFLCVVFAVLGALPLGLGFLVRTGPVRAWAARETSALLARQLGVTARYDVVVQAWPVVVALENVEVESSDGLGPFLVVERVAVRPRPFSLLGGRLDAGDVEIVGPRIRAVVADGALQNLRYKLPERHAGGDSRVPFASLAITDAHVDAMVEGVRVSAQELDLDVSTEDEGAFEIALRLGRTTVTRVREMAGRPGEDAVDDDVICRAEMRARAQGRSLLVRRLLLAGSADFDPDPATRPSCDLADEDWRRVDVRLGAVHVDLPPDAAQDPRPAPSVSTSASASGARPRPAAGVRINGRVHARLPAPLVHRLKAIDHVTGAVTLDVQVDYDGAAPLPHVDGHVVAESAGIDGKIFGKRIDLDVAIDDAVVHVKNLVSQWADGKVAIPDVTIEPFEPGVPINTGPIALDGLEIAGLLRDLGAHPESHVAWTLEKGRFDWFKGHLDPPQIEGPLTIQTRGFEIYDRPAADPAKVRMLSVREGTVRCNFVVNGSDRSPYSKHKGVLISHAAIDTGRSHLDATVNLGFDTIIDIDVRDDTTIDLSELSPLGTIPVSGRLGFSASGTGRFEHPKVTGELRIADFDFAGLPVGEVESPRFAFEPMTLDLFDARLHHGQSLARAGQVRLAFDKGATVIADADVDTRDAPGLRVKDLFEVFRFDKDPRFAEIDGVASGKARVHYVLGGHEDHCGGGVLSVDTSMDLADVTLIGERFERGTLDADLLWDDQAAGAAGLHLDLRSATLRKGEGSVLIGATVRHGGFVSGNVVGSGIPLSRLDAFRSFGKSLDGTAQVVADLRGTLSAFQLGADVNLSRLRIGPATLGPSHLRVGLVPPAGAPPPREGKACGNPHAGKLDLAELEKDVSDGDFTIDGVLFDGQVALEDLRVSRQRKRVLRGRVAARSLDLGTLANLAPAVAFRGVPPTGSLSATLDIGSLPLAAPERARLSLTLEKLTLAREGISAELVERTKRFELVDDELRAEDFKIRVRSASGLAATVVAGGAVHRVLAAPGLDIGVRVEPVDLGSLSADIPSVEHAAGKLAAAVRIAGPPSALRYTGSAELRKGELSLKGVPLGMREMEVDIDIVDGDARLKRAVAHVGAGTLQATGRMPLRGPDAGSFLANINARGVKLPVADGIDLTADAELEATYRVAPPGAPRSLPEVKGTVELTHFSYTRPIALNLSLSQLGRAPRTNVDTYDPANDVVRFNVDLVSPRPLRFSNNLVEMDLEVVSPGLVLSGTNQRFGARGLLRVLPDSKIQLRNNEFLVREGFVRFDNPLKIVPKVELRAQTEYRRYASAAGPEPPASGAVSSGEGAGQTGAAASPVAAAASTSVAGIWRITLQARGEADNLQVTLTSDPPLSQEDIVLLLTIGMTRAEIDRGATAALGETVGLEALSALTGADKAVKTIVPLIDEFRFGTGYSSKTARTEPTVTVGKRVTDSVRASVTTGVSEDREVRANLEWRLNRHISVQGSYDNLNDVSSSPLGNVGVDFRWRLEFE